MDVKVVVFDTCALLLMMQERVDVMEDVKRALDSVIIPVVTVSVVRELWELSRRGGVKGKAASTVLEKIIPRYFTVASYDGRADDDVLMLAKESGGALVTCDMGLKRRAEELGVTVVYYRRALRGFTVDY